jgi:hypothetical protein
VIFRFHTGQHYSGGWLHKLSRPIQRSPGSWHRVEFSESCCYRFDGVDQLDINKLYGFSNGVDLHRDSARFGWRSTLSGQIILSSYCYIDGERVTQELCTVPTRRQVRTALLDLDDHYEFSVLDHKGETHRHLVKKTKRFCLGWRLWPYFGGNRPAPHPMWIRLD